MPSEHATVKRQIRVSKNEYDRITLAAQHVGLSTSAYLRMMLFEEPLPPRLEIPSTTEHIVVGIDDMLKKAEEAHAMLQARFEHAEDQQRKSVSKATYKMAITLLEKRLRWLEARCMKTRIEIERHTDPDRLLNPHSYFFAQKEAADLAQHARQRSKQAVLDEDQDHIDKDTDGWN